jgi:hypothetical protein
MDFSEDAPVGKGPHADSDGGRLWRRGRDPGVHFNDNYSDSFSNIVDKISSKNYKYYLTLHGDLFGMIFFGIFDKICTNITDIWFYIYWYQKPYV